MTIKIEIPSDAEFKPLALAIGEALVKYGGGAEFETFDIVLPITQYAQISQRRMGDGSDKTILNFMRESSPWLGEISPWTKCTNAGAGGAIDRMVCYPKNSTVVSAVVPMEFQTLPVQQRNLRFIVPCLATTAGVVSRYPVAMQYADGL